jgi:RNA polymerase sigma-70 factor (ECF subfamily)
MGRPADTALRTAGRAGRGRAGALDAPTPHRSGRVAPAGTDVPGPVAPARTDVPGPDGPDPGGPVPGSVAATKPDLTAAVAAAQHGDEQAFRILYRDVQPRLLRYLRAMVGDDAEDVASEAWLQIARDLAGFSGDSDGFRGWAATIARHRAMDHQRRHRRRPQPAAISIDDLGDLPAGQDTAEIALDAVSTEAAIAMIAALPRDQAEAVLLRVVMGLDADRAGKVLGKKAGAVRTAAHRGLRRLAARLEPPPDGQVTGGKRQAAGRNTEPGGNSKE